MDSWTPENRVRCRCDSCQSAFEKHLEISTWLEDSIEKVEKLCTQHGWSISEKSTANTGSIYLTVEKDSEDDFDSVVIRISDHSTAYCSEDISISFKPGFDDHTFDDLKKRLLKI